MPITNQIDSESIIISPTTPAALNRKIAKGFEESTIDFFIVRIVNG
jgi:hypothetical protein